MTVTVGLFIFEQVELLDFSGPYEVFTTAARVRARQPAATAATFDVFTIGGTQAALRTRAGLVVRPDYTIANHPPLDVLLIPGGVVDDELDKPEVVAWIAACAARAKITASVCTGAFLLAQAGLLDGKAATTHWEDLADLRARFPSVRVCSGPRWVDEGNRVTSAGISADIDMSLHLVERLVDRDLAVKTARQLDFHWTENS